MRALCIVGSLCVVACGGSIDVSIPLADSGTVVVAKDASAESGEAGKDADAVDARSDAPTLPACPVAGASCFMAGHGKTICTTAMRFYRCECIKRSDVTCPDAELRWELETCADDPKSCMCIAECE